MALPSWFASQGFSAADIAFFVFITALPWSFKLFAGPLMDRFSYPAMGRRRPWVLVAQLGIALAFLSLTLAPDPKSYFYVTAFLGFMVNFFASTQDVAVDGMAIDVLPPEDRARANAFMFGGQLLGISLGSSGGGYALNLFGLSGVALLGAGATALIFLVPLFVREREGEKLLPWTSGQASQHALNMQVEKLLPLLKSAMGAIFSPASLLLILTVSLAKLADGLVSTMLPVYTVQELGWADVRYNDWYAAGGIISAFVGLAVSPLFDRFGAGKAITAIVVCKVAIVLFLVMAALIGSGQAIQNFIILNYITMHLFTIVAIATMMSICTSQVAASQFAVYMALMNLMFANGSLVYAALQTSFDANGLFLWAALLSGALLIPWWYVNKRYLS